MSREQKGSGVSEAACVARQKEREEGRGKVKQIVGSADSDIIKNSVAYIMVSVLNACCFPCALRVPLK